jgi:hypothetical protein
MSDRESRLKQTADSESPKDPLESVRHVSLQNIPQGVDRRAFLMRNALIGATAILTGRTVSADDRASRSAAVPPTPQLSPTLYVVKEEKGPVLTILDESRPIQLTHDRTNAYHLRLLPALHKAAR